MKTNKTIREKIIERKVCEYAESKGWLVFKFVSPGNRSVPDRIFLKNGIIIFIEFKREGEVPTKIQEHMIKIIEDQKFKVFVVSNVEYGKYIFSHYI